MSNSSNNGSGTMRAIFGIIMILIYIGMGILMFINFFNFYGIWLKLRWVVGGLFILYGFWRAYRQIKIVEVPVDDDDSDEMPQ
ncbi:MAG: hypothetical protein J1E84_05800 [Muribaculaceae bacterium]|nr:hypothetical protein [Muribaculaceae bacterium]